MPDAHATRRFKGIVRLDRVSDEQLLVFDCGKAVLNDWLVTRARANDVNGGSRTYVVTAPRPNQRFGRGFPVH